MALQKRFAVKKARIFLIVVATLYSALFLPSGAFAKDTITVQELRDLQTQHVDLLLLDARALKNYHESHIEGAILPLPNQYYLEQELFASKVISTPPDADAALVEGTKDYPKDRKIVTYCNVGCRAAVALMNKLKKLGFTDVSAMEEGIQVWEQKGFPVVKAVPDPSKKQNSGL